jgi:hypothetical protein
MTDKYGKIHTDGSRSGGQPVVDSIEAKAQALLVEVRKDRGAHPMPDEPLNRTYIAHEALYRAIERHEAFKQEVSDAIENEWANLHYGAKRNLDRFRIPLPKPDPLVAVLLDMELSSDQEEGQHDAKWLRLKLDALGFEIREKGQANV